MLRFRKPIKKTLTIVVINVSQGYSVLQNFNEALFLKLNRFCCLKT